MMIIETRLPEVRIRGHYVKKAHRKGAGPGRAKIPLNRNAAIALRTDSRRDDAQGPNAVVSLHHCKSQDHLSQ